MTTQEGLRLGRKGVDDVLEFLGLLWAIDHQLQRISKRLARTSGVTGPQRLALRVIERDPDGCGQEVAAALHLHKSTLTGILQRLERQGLVRRVADPGDARRSRLRVTTKGRRTSAATGSPVEGAVKRALGQLTPVQQSCACKALRAIALALEKNCATLSPS